jgi:ABC-type multidrug transport system ATPase subunit
MKISLNNISKKYQKSFIFKNLSFEFEEGSTYAIVGSNGSGKSTLIKILAGFQSPSFGDIKFQNTSAENSYKKIAFCAPYLDLIEEMNLPEMIQFHASFKPFLPEINSNLITELLGFDNEKYIKDYSSGMKQRVKLALTFFSDVPVILLDEPTTNLDKQGVQWYLSLVEKYQKNRTIIVASNIEQEYSFCKNFIEIEKYK